MEKIELKDSFRVSDSKVNGYVVIKENDKIILRKENMIVERGRIYLKNLVSAKLGLTTENRKINAIKFGTGLNAVLPTDVALGTNISAYDLNLTSLGWRKYTEVNYDHGGTNPAVVVGDYFYNTTDGDLLIGTAGSPATWEEAANYTKDTSIPGSGTENHLFYDTEDHILYIYSKLLVLTELSGNNIGIKATIYLFGRNNNQIVFQNPSISELGLFLDGTGTHMFSRLVFDAIPLTDNNNYEISYYIYF
jgi:hypothetical protein